MEPSMASVLTPHSSLPSVRAKAQFSKDTGVTPVSLVREAGSGPDTRKGVYEDHEISIYDGRPIADKLDLDKQGFILTKFDTAVTDFYDDEEVRSVYYPEMEQIVKQATGCSKVVVFDHTIRVDNEDTQTELKVRGPVRNMHNDFTRNSAPQRVRDLLPPEEAEVRLKKRYGSINVWRPIVGPVETAPLAICGWDSIEEKNLIAAERRYNDRIGGVLHLVHNPEQRWYYFPRMEREEVVLLKCFDSLEDGTAKWTCHGSFKDPNSPSDARPRESIEIRTLYFFDD
jgi:hypothetical protein